MNRVQDLPADSVVYQAVGVLIASLGVDVDGGADLLITSARRRGVSLRSLALNIVAAPRDAEAELVGARPAS